MLLGDLTHLVNLCANRLQTPRPRVPVPVAHHPVPAALGAEDCVGIPLRGDAPDRHLWQLHRPLDSAG